MSNHRKSLQTLTIDFLINIPPNKYENQNHKWHFPCCLRYTLSCQNIKAVCIQVVYKDNSGCNRARNKEEKSLHEACFWLTNS